jgi:predicted DCC family thiol-disulfide oxidoreductase YuxK
MVQQPVILFDGVCNFCNGAVNFVIKKDKKSALKFAPLQSTEAHVLLASYDVPSADMKTFIFIENGRSYIRSAAALRVCRYLNSFWPLMYGFIIIPKFIRDGIYNQIAKNRYRWFGKKEVCMVPTPEVRSRFLNEKT